MRQPALKAQVEFHNRNVAQRVDMIAIDGKHATVRGYGKWKQLAPRQILRTAFGPPASTTRSFAAQTKSSTRHVIDLVFVCSALLARKQADAVDYIMQSPKPRWLLLQLQ